MPRASHDNSHNAHNPPGDVFVRDVRQAEGARRARPIAIRRPALARKTSGAASCGATLAPDFSSRRILPSSFAKLCPTFRQESTAESNPRSTPINPRKNQAQGSPGNRVSRGTRRFNRSRDLNARISGRNCRAIKKEVYQFGLEKVCAKESGANEH